MNTSSSDGIITSIVRMEMAFPENVEELLMESGDSEDEDANGVLGMDNDNDEDDELQD